MTDAEAEQALADAIDEIDVSDVDVVALLDERDQFKTMAQRVQADFDNFRKQSTARAQADADRATGRLAEALLPVLDAAEAAYLRHPEEVGPLLNQMLVELKKQGLETLDLDGQPFDPEVAEAVAHEPADGGEPIIAEVLRSGYRWKGKTLRAGDGQDHRLNESEHCPAEHEPTRRDPERRSPRESPTRMVREGLLRDPRCVEDGHRQGDQEGVSQARE